MCVHAICNSLWQMKLINNVKGFWNNFNKINILRTFNTYIEQWALLFPFPGTLSASFQTPFWNLRCSCENCDDGNETGRDHKVSVCVCACVCAKEAQHRSQMSMPMCECKFVYMCMCWQFATGRCFCTVG